MIRVNFDGAQPESITEGGDAIPAGQYLCRVETAEEKMTNAGDGYLNYSLKVADGEYEGRLAGYDKLFFHTEKTKNRSAYVLKAMGFDVDGGNFELEAEELINRPALVTVEHKLKCPACKYDVKAKGKSGTEVIFGCTGNVTCTWSGTKEECKVIAAPAYAGYEAVEGGGGGGAPAGSKDTPTQFDLNSIPF